MRVLVVGAGVIGSLCGAKLDVAGHDVSILALFRRLEGVTESGLRI